MTALTGRIHQGRQRGIKLAGAIIAGAALWMAQLTAAQSPSGLPAPLVYLRDVAPAVVQDMRYATADNFTGAVVPGYGAAECILTRETAEALSRVQADLKDTGLSLKVYDCYRPRAAIQAFVDWAALPPGQADVPRFHPRIPREKLFELGYIAAVSGHSRADTVDLTLVPAGGPADFSVDMGTDFDFFDPKSNTASPEITAQQRQWRQTLLRAMSRRGFRNYDREWWHFTHGAGQGPSYSLPITPRPKDL